MVMCAISPWQCNHWVHPLATPGVFVFYIKKSPKTSVTLDVLTIALAWSWHGDVRNFSGWWLQLCRLESQPHAPIGARSADGGRLAT